MSYTDISALKSESDRQLALRLEKAVASIRNEVVNDAKDLRAAAQRITFLTSCFFEDYQDVCRQIQEVDKRFYLGLMQIVTDRNAVYKMIEIYFELVFKNKKEEQILRIRDALFKAGIRVSAGQINGKALTVAVVAAAAYGFKLSAITRRYVIHGTTTALFLMKVHGLVAPAKESAERLHRLNPEYYRLLYARNLEMMFFLIEPLFINSQALRTGSLSDEEIVKIITYMVK